MSDHDHDHDHGQSAADKRLNAAATEGCMESRLLLSRRAFLGVSASFCTWAFAPRVASAAGSMDNRFLIVILRGGMDGLHMVPPLYDPKYAEKRGSGSLGLKATDTLTLGTGGDGIFAIHKMMPNFQKMFTRGEASIIHGIAPPLRVQSHFEGQFNLENGYGPAVVRTSRGWLNRLLETLPKGNEMAPSPALHVGPAPLIIAGKERVQAWAPLGLKAIASPQRLEQYYEGLTYNYLHDQLEAAVSTNTLAGGNQPGDKLDASFTGAGKLMGAQGGPRIGVLSVEGWDTHQDEKIELDAKMAKLDSCLELFKTAIGSAAWSQTVVVCVSEFGRTVSMNGTQGSDHGIGTVALLTGGAVQGGKVIHTGNGLADVGRDNYLPAAYDTRQLFTGILKDHLGISPSQFPTVFNGFDAAATPPLTNLIKGVSAPAAAPAPVPAPQPTNGLGVSANTSSPNMM